VTVLEAVAVLRDHKYRLLSDDPYRPRSYSKWCVVCGDEWPCAPRTEAASTIRLADQLLAAHEAAESCPR
jgi:6-phosphogluconolactonase/glucosamine-6-phosphate isomerase/deaminase